MEAGFGEDRQRVFVRREESGLRGGGEIVPYAIPKRVNESGN